MEITFYHLHYPGRVVLMAERTVDPAITGAQDGAIGPTNCKEPSSLKGVDTYNAFYLRQYYPPRALQRCCPA